MLSRLSLSCDRKDRPYSRRVTKKPRQRFTPWLHDQIEKGDIEGLEWINKEEGIFRVPWVRVDKPEFEPGHAELFKRWAFHTGKYRKGDQPDPSTWKTRFRCALRKMQEIKEIRELGKLEGNKPYRAFKFEPKLKEGNPNSPKGPDRLHVPSRRRSSCSSESTSSTEASVYGESHSQAYPTQDAFSWPFPSSESDLNEIEILLTQCCPSEFDMSMYFPGITQSQFGFSSDRSSGYGGQREQEAPSYHELQPTTWNTYPAQNGFDTSSVYNEGSSFSYFQMIQE